MTQSATGEILAAITAGKNPPKPTQLPIHGTGGSECGWKVLPFQTTTRYEKEESSSDEQKTQFALTEFWRKLACQVGAACHGKYRNALSVDATVDYGHLDGKAFIFFGSSHQDHRHPKHALPDPCDAFHPSLQK